MGKKLALTAEQKKERSDRAKQLVKEGKIGGPRPGSGRPRKKRASEIVAEKARDRASDIVTAFEDLINNGPPAVRLQAAKDWLLIEQQEAKLQMDEDRYGDDMTEDELKELIVKRLARIQAEKDMEKIQGAVTIPDADVQDVTFEEETPAAKQLGEGSPWG